MQMGSSRPLKRPAERDLAVAAELAQSLSRLIVVLRTATATSGVGRAQLQALSALRRGTDRITDLAALEQVTQPTMTAMIGRLEHAGWVTRCPDPIDRRSIRLALTEAGERVLDRVLGERSAALAARLAELGAGDLDRLEAALPAIRALARDEPDSPPHRRPTETVERQPQPQRRTPDTRTREIEELEA